MDIKRGKMTFGGAVLTELANEFGTPLYVYDGDKIKRQYKRLQAAFQGIETRFLYACKALNNINVMRLLLKEGAGLDAVSINEVEIGLIAGFQPQDILFTPNCVSMQEYERAVELGVRINIDNISILEQFGDRFGNSVPVCVRLNPHIMAGGNVNISTGHIDSKFGISIHQLRHLTRVVKSHNIKINGLHMHTGSDILDAEVFLRGAELLFDAAEHFPDLEYLDFGSGFKVGYKEGDVTTDIEALGAAISKRFAQFCKDYGRELTLMFEPGKFLVSEAGVLLVKVSVVKQTTATVFAGVDSGQNHLIRPMFYNAHHDIVNVSNPEGTTRIYTIVGNICETDTFGYDRKLTEVREGDVLAIKNAGAYGFTMSNNYNARFRPAEVLLLDGKPHLIRKRETLEDITRNQVMVEL
ncbi:MAG: diaminopimelate decarboxylase [Sphingobacteriaceae bacterium]|nr:diaminopimelate decarboxylase [Sphingobacteriaceae bacterium]